MKSRLPIILAAILLAAFAVAGSGLALAVFGGRAATVTSGGLLGKVSGAVVSRLDAPASDDPTSMLFTVVPGDSAAEIGDRLAAQRLIQDPNAFRLIANYYGVTTGLQVGDYELRRNMRPTEILAKIQRGEVKLLSLTVPEGLTGEEIARLVGERGLGNRDEIRRLFQDGKFSFAFLANRPVTATLEGYLFPETYRFPPRATAREVVETMLRTFEERVLPEFDRADRRGLSLNQIVTLASIVEREAVVPEERPIIASVYLNRLRGGIKLDADPTVQYALGRNPDNVAKFGLWKPQLSERDLQIESPYNTYRYPGLPPGPIASPGLASIRAVLAPATTEYLFFVARGDGSHIFARTYEEHLANVNRVR